MKLLTSLLFYGLISVFSANNVLAQQTKNQQHKGVNRLPLKSGKPNEKVSKKPNDTLNGYVNLTKERISDKAITSYFSKSLPTLIAKAKANGLPVGDYQYFLTLYVNEKGKIEDVKIEGSDDTNNIYYIIKSLILDAPNFQVYKDSKGIARKTLRSSRVNFYIE